MFFCAYPWFSTPILKRDDYMSQTFWCSLVKLPVYKVPWTTNHHCLSCSHKHFIVFHCKEPTCSTSLSFPKYTHMHCCSWRDVVHILACISLVHLNNKKKNVGPPMINRSLNIFVHLVSMLNFNCVYCDVTQTGKPSLKLSAMSVFVMICLSIQNHTQQIFSRKYFTRKSRLVLGAEPLVGLRGFLNYY